MTAEDVHRRMLEEGADVGLATVYRVLAQLTEVGILSRNVFESGVAVYAVHQGKHHDHLIGSRLLWWRWPLGAAAAEPIADQEPGASETSALFEVDGRKFLPRIAADYSSTMLDELDPKGAHLPSPIGPGNIWGVIRLR